MISKSGGADLIEFGFLGAANLESPKATHMHEYTIAFLGTDRMDATWILWDEGRQSDRRLFPVERR